MSLSHYNNAHFFFMFWRRNRVKEVAVEETDDFVKLQKQFGITPVNDADIQAELQTLLSYASPTEEECFLEIDNDDDDDEAKILRCLQLDGIDINSHMEESDSHEVAKKELRGVLQEVHEDAIEGHSREAAEISGQSTHSGAIDPLIDKATQIHAIKMEAVKLKREGKIQEALTKFREAKRLQEESSKQKQGTLKLEREVTPHMNGMLNDENEDVVVTDADMQDPEYLSQLAQMGLIDNNVDSTDSESVQYQDAIQKILGLKTQIHDCKLQAVQLKRQNQIADALTCMRKIKELEAERDRLRPLLAKQTPETLKQETWGESKSDNHIASAGCVPVVPLKINVDLNNLNCDNANAKVISENMWKQAVVADPLKMGAKYTFPIDSAQTMLQTPPNAVQNSEANSVSLRSVSSLDEDYLIDSFDVQFDSEEDSNHLTSVMSSESLASAPFIAEAENLTSLTYDVRTKVETSYFADLSAQLQKTRQKALVLKRKGDTHGALEALRRAKQIQSLIDHRQQTFESTVFAKGSQPNIFDTDRFQEIEHLLVNFGNRAMVLAKENLSVNRKKASEWLSKRKRYEAELQKLRLKRQNPLQLSPNYEIVKSSYEVEHELPFVSDDEIRVGIKSVNGLSQMAGKSVFVKFCLNFPSGASHEGQTPEFQINCNTSFSTELQSSQTCFNFKLARSRGTMRIFEIKKAVFEVWKPAALFRNPELVARAYQELTPLLTCCEINTHIPFLGSNRKPCGGYIEIVLQVRRPLKHKEIRVETVEDLIIGDYPEPLALSPENILVSSIVQDEIPVCSSTSATNGPKSSYHQNIEVNEVEPSSVSTFSDDPHDLDLIVSYDVINEELEKVGAKLSSLSGPAAIEYGDRYDSLALKKQLLEIEMQSGKLTLDAYVERLHNRISADRELISKLLSSNRRLDAARVLHRIKIMEKELEMEGSEG